MYHKRWSMYTFRVLIKYAHFMYNSTHTLTHTDTRMCVCVHDAYRRAFRCRNARLYASRTHAHTHTHAHNTHTHTTHTHTHTHTHTQTHANTPLQPVPEEMRLEMVIRIRMEISIITVKVPDLFSNEMSEKKPGMIGQDSDCPFNVSSFRERADSEILLGFSIHLLLT